MGIIVRDTASKEILFYMKGADTVMAPIGKEYLYFAACRRRPINGARGGGGGFALVALTPPRYGVRVITSFTLVKIPNIWIY